MKTEWGAWRIPTKLETINLISNILGCIGLCNLAGYVGFVIWLIVALFFWDTVLTVKDYKNEKSSDFGFYVTVGIEIFYGFIHPTTIKSAVELTKNLIGGQESAGAYGWIGAIILTGMSIFSLYQSINKTADSIA